MITPGLLTCNIDVIVLSLYYDGGLYCYSLCYEVRRDGSHQYNMIAKLNDNEEIWAE